MIAEGVDHRRMNEYANDIEAKVVRSDDIFDYVEIIDSIVDDLWQCQKRTAQHRQQNDACTTSDFRRFEHLAVDALEAEFRMTSSKAVIAKRIAAEYTCMIQALVSEISNKIDLLKSYKCSRAVIIAKCRK